MENSRLTVTMSLFIPLSEKRLNKWPLYMFTWKPLFKGLANVHRNRITHTFMSIVVTAVAMAIHIAFIAIVAVC